MQQNIRAQNHKKVGLCIALGAGVGSSVGVTIGVIFDILAFKYCNRWRVWRKHRSGCGCCFISKNTA
ncbi:hypothetical protein PCIT_a0196 [Pseudoalteromonas citrea]|uniref:Uncharacterized protein n=2 Tax=Pseudoalteromonas citrea TaxID=43655 RepID=A0AAD4FST8_9GAMM|nr:hypothetical protein PCIT_a0196 [Pseudoalteromonas citrea]